MLFNRGGIICGLMMNVFILVRIVNTVIKRLNLGNVVTAC